MTTLDPRTLMRVEEALTYYLESLERQKERELDQDKIAQVKEDIEIVRLLLHDVKDDYNQQSG